MIKRPQASVIVRSILAFTLAIGVFGAGSVSRAFAASGDPERRQGQLGGDAARSDRALANPALLSSGILDDFNRVDGSLGSNWSNSATTNITSDEVLIDDTYNTSTNSIWNPQSFGVDQEAFITLTGLNVVDPGSSISLILKKQQSSSSSSDMILVAYRHAQSHIQVYVVEGGSFTDAKAPQTATFANGDQFGAAIVGSTLYIYKNGTEILTEDVSSYDYLNNPGYVGFRYFIGGTDTEAIDDFGGGTVGGSPEPTPTQPPIASPTFTPTVPPLASPTATLPGSGTTFPSTGMLDNFDRADGSLGSNWNSSAPTNITSSQVLIDDTYNSSTNSIWNAQSFGADQEAFMTLTGLNVADGGSSISLILKRQQPAASSGDMIVVAYRHAQSHIQVYVVEGGSFADAKTPQAASFANGDQLGAGIVGSTLSIYKNGTQILTQDISSYDYINNPGYVGFRYFVTGTETESIDNFGGGTLGGSATMTPPPPACTDPTTCNPVIAFSALWRCNIAECTGADWIGSAISWPSWSAYNSNARTGNNSRTVYSESGQVLYPYMGSWADGCQVTAVSGSVLIIEWERGKDTWRSTFLDPGQSHTIDLVAPENGAMIEADGSSSFSVSLANCTPQDILSTNTSTPVPTASPTFTETATNTATFTPSATQTPVPTNTATSTNTFTPTVTRTPSPTNTATSTNTFTPTASRTPSPTATRTASPTNTVTRTPSPTATPAYSYQPLYLSLTDDQTIGGIAAADEDILKFDGQNWSIFFDGSDVGTSAVDLSAFTLLDADSILMSFNASITLNGISVNPQDVVRFDATSLGSATAGTFSMYFDGSDVGMSSTDESIDAIDRLSDGRLLFSTTGILSVSAGTANDEDVIAFTPTSLGNTTAGSFSMYLDGSDVGLATTTDEDVDALDVTSNGTIYLSSAGNFAVTGASGANEDVFVCVPTSIGSTSACNFSPALYFDGSTWGLSLTNVDGFNFLATP